MRKKQLLQIALKGPSEEMVRKVKEDRCIERSVNRPRWAYKDGKGYYEDYYESIRTYRHRMTMVSMMDARIMVKVFPKSPAPMSWGGFFQIAADIFEGKIDGKNTYRNVFGEEIPKREPDRLGSNVPKQPTVPPMPKNAEPAAGKTEPETPIAPAQKEPAAIDNSNVKTDSAIAEGPAAEPAEEPEQVEIDEILPPPVEPDPMRDLKDRFTAELNTLRVALDCDNFAGMAQTIERLEYLRVKMAGMAELK